MGIVLLEIFKQDKLKTLCLAGGEQGDGKWEECELHAGKAIHTSSQETRDRQCDEISAFYDLLLNSVAVLFENILRKKWTVCR